jgi:AAA family ATP:ADP antiporter
MVLTFNIVNTLGEFMLGEFVVSGIEEDLSYGAVAAPEAEKEKRIGAFYGEFFGAVNLVSLLLQILAVPPIFKHIGVRGALFVLPVIALGSYSLMAFLPVLGIVKVAKILENSADYSVQNTARHALSLPCSREAKYKAKVAIDTFCCRAGDVLQAGIVLAGTHLAFTMRQFSVVNMTLIGLWLLLILYICREHRKVVSHV